MATKKVVLGFNGTPESRDALRLAGALARLDGSRIIVVRAYDVPMLPITILDAEPDLLPDSESVRREIAEQLPGVGFELFQVLSSSPARALYVTAEREEADLVVVGSSHQGKIGKVLPGSTGQRLLHGAPCAVAIAPRGYARREHYGLGRVGVGYDGRPESEHALAGARRLAAELGAELRVVGVCPPETGRADARSEHGPLREEFAKRVESAAASAEEGEGELSAVKSRAVLRDGDPATVLAEQAIELDVLVVGSRGYGVIRRTMLGGVSHDLVHDAPCPVIVVPRGDDGEPDPGHAPERPPSVDEES